jgi:hypothetical protein
MTFSGTLTPNLYMLTCPPKTKFPLKKGKQGRFEEVGIFLPIAWRRV